MHSGIKAVGHPIDAGSSEAERELWESSRDETRRFRCGLELSRGSRRWSRTSEQVSAVWVARAGLLSRRCHQKDFGCQVWGCANVHT